MDYEDHEHQQIGFITPDREVLLKHFCEFRLKGVEYYPLVKRLHKNYGKIHHAIHGTIHYFYGDFP